MPLNYLNLFCVYCNDEVDSMLFGLLETHLLVEHIFGKSCYNNN